MPDYRLVDYITQSLRAGYSHQQIRQGLLNSGWPHQQVDEALNHVLSGPSQPIPRLPAAQPQGYPQQAQQPAPGQQKPMGILRKFRMVLAHPNQFFNQVKPEEGFEEPVKFSLFFIFVNILIVNLLFLVAGAFFSLSDMGNVAIIGVIIGMLFVNLVFVNLYVILLAIGLFIAAGIEHIFALIFGARKGYRNTYRAVVYALTPIIFIWPVVALVYINPWLATIGYFIVYIWSITLEIKGLSKFHDISGKRAFAIVITPIIIMVLLTVTAFLLLFSYLGSYTAHSLTASGTCLGETNTYITLTNMGSEPISLVGCTGVGSITGISATCGDIIVTRNDGGSMNAYFNKATIEAYALGSISVATFKDEGCTTAGNPKICRYAFSTAGGMQSTEVSVRCPG